MALAAHLGCRAPDLLLLHSNMACFCLSERDETKTDTHSGEMKSKAKLHDTDTSREMREEGRKKEGVENRCWVMLKVKVKHFSNKRWM